MNLDLITSQFAWLGPWFFFIGAMVEALPFIGTFLPGATIVTLGGFATAHGYFSLTSVIFFSVTGAIVGDAISFYLGTHGGTYARRKKLIKDSTMAKGESFFEKYGNQGLFWGRFIGPIRSVIPFLAGIAKMKQKTFWTWNIISGVAWGFFYVMLGRFSGNLIAVILKRWSHRLALILFLLSISPVFIWLYNRHGRSVAQYFNNQSLAFTQRIEHYAIIKNLKKRYPAFGELFIWKSFQLKLYFSAIGFIFLTIMATIDLIFDWI